MFCREASKLLSLYLDGLLSVAQTQRLEEHTTGCVNCRNTLELMQQIPVALQTDKLAAPSEDFTKLVMQRIVMQQVVVKQNDGRGNFSSYSQTQVSVVSSYTTQPNRAKQISTPASEPKTDADDAEGEAVAKFVQESNVIDFTSRRPMQTTMPFYLLRFSAAAAAFVLGFGLLFYVFQVNGNAISTTDTSGRAVMALANLLTSSFSSPLEVVIGAAVSVVIIVSLWFVLTRPNNKNVRS